MNRRLTSILLLAFVVASLASYLVYRTVSNQAQGSRPKTTQVAVATRDLELGTLIKETDLTMKEWIGELPKGSVTETKGLVGRGVTSQIYLGEPVLESRLAAAGSGGGLAATIRPGMRACAVRVNEFVGVAGFVVPGMRVDVLITGTAPGQPTNEGPKVKTLLQNIEVLSAGTNIQKDNEGKPVQVPVVNLLVTPEQAELLSLASNETRIQLVLRNPLDTDTANTPGSAMAAIFSNGSVPAPKAVNAPIRRAAAPAVPKVEQPAPRMFLVEVLNGSKRTEEKFSESPQ